MFQFFLFRSPGTALQVRSWVYSAGLAMMAATTLGACQEEPSTQADPSPTPLPEPTPTPEPSPSPLPTQDPFRIIGSTPSTGAMAVPLGTSFTLLFNEPLTASAADFTVVLETAQGQETTLSAEASEISEDGTALTFYGVGLTRDTAYTLTATFHETDAQSPSPEEWPATYNVDFTTEFPCGISFDIAAGVQVVQLGANPKLASTLNDLLSKSTLLPVSLLYVDMYSPELLPQEDFKVVSGLAYESDQEGLYIVDPDYGFSVAMTGCSISATGDFTCGPQDFAFPIPITDETAINLYFTDAIVSGLMSDSGNLTHLDDFVLEGVITEEDIERISAEIGIDISLLVTLDVDLNGDGVNDAATGIASSSPEWLEFEWCDPTISP